MTVISSNNIKVSISEFGAEIKSIVFCGKEYMWDSDPKFWAQSAPIMFPICGGLKGGKYVLDGKEYEMGKHGFAKLNQFTVESKTENSVTMLLKNNEMTEKAFPFSFEFRVIFEAIDNSLKVTYETTNTDTKTMWCTVGSHEAYACPEGIEAYDVVFPERETLYAYGLNGDIVTDYTKLIIEDSNVLPLKDEYFYLDALVFRNLKSRSAKLVNRENGRSVNVDFDGFDYFVIWHKYTAPYICLEPWCGIPDVAGSSYDITKKEGMYSIPAGDKLTKTHTITVG